MKHLVIIVGGISNHIWPIFTAQYPKQVLDISDVR